MSPILESIGSVKGFGWGALLADSAFNSIATFTGTGSTGTATFSSIPSTYSHLQLRITSKGSFSYMGVRFNSDSASNYAWKQVRGTGSAGSTQGFANQTEGYLMPSLSANDTYPTCGVIDILDYKNTSKFKTFKSFYGSENNSTVGHQTVAFSSSLWRSTSAISSMTVFASGGDVFQSGTIISLYGIKGA